MSEINEICNMIISNSKNETIIKLPFLGSSLSNLNFVQSFVHLAVDGQNIYYNPEYIINEFKTGQISRNFLHSLLHCVFHHIFVYNSYNQVLWDLACDICVETIINEIQLDFLSQSRKQDISDIKKEVKKFTAEHIYEYLATCDADTLTNYMNEFYVDDHSIWYLNSQKDVLDYLNGSTEDTNDSDSDAQVNNSSSGKSIKVNSSKINMDKSSLMELWDNLSSSMKVDLEIFSKDNNKVSQNLLEILSISTEEKIDYSTFLKKFATFNEAIKTNDNEFDYIFYTYGMKLNHNVPLIEPLEYQEVKNIQEFVIAIDTSGSVQGELVRNFLIKTFNILLDKVSFTKKFKLYIIQCDDEIKSVDEISTVEEIKVYMSKVVLKGFGNTDFRPVFNYIDNLVKTKVFKNLKGMIYFTDAMGPFPNKSPNYKVAIGYFDDDVDKENIPSWALKLKLRRSEFKGENI